MPNSISIQQLYELHQKQLKLEWVSGQKNPIIIEAQTDDLGDEVLAGYFNVIHPHQIQIIGHKEIKYFSSLEKNAIHEILNSLDLSRPSIFMVANNANIPDSITQFIVDNKLALLKSSLSGAKLIEYLRYYLSQHTANRITRHGVFLEVMGIGVLITGESGIGKSELALELISRGHRLIADDAPDFYRSGPEIIHGQCPPALDGFIEVRGLGILNVRAMFGDMAVLGTKRLRLVIHMQLFSEERHTKMDRLSTTQHYENILDVEVPVVVLPVAPGRNMSVIVEAAVQNHVLSLNGYNATTDFIKRQQHLIQNNET
ncbi:MAG: HPr(Ser) kinase/phosphatase [Gammaproteobacteria bacterium]|nr:HPr(Ser) kinase/phosphatase [Gammaproteobacteria bacterium]MDH5777730.1 HPr(Ser) kinase/phosphatase [Gammaproteobacteria bacterium]